MSWKNVEMRSFLSERKGRFKPNDHSIEGLKRIEKIDFSGNIYLSEKSSKTDMILVKKGDLVISGINVEKGAMSIYKGDEDVTATIHYSSYVYNPEKIDVEFLKHFLKSAEFIEALKEQVPGGIKTEIKPKHILPLKVSIPTSIVEQRKLVEFLDMQNKTIENQSTELTHQLDLVKQLRQAFLREAMQGKLVKQNGEDESAIELLAKIKAEKEQLIKEKKIKKQKPLPPISEDEIPFEIPESWAWCRLGDISNNRLGKMLDGIKNKGELLPYLRNLNVQWYSFELDDIKEMRFEPSEFEEYSVKKGDLLICEGGEPGRCAIWNSDDESFKFQKALHRVRFLGDIESWIYQYYFDFICKSKLVVEYFTGAGIKHLTGKSLNKMLLPLPPLSEQKRIVAKLDELMAYCDTLEESIKNSQIQNEMLLSQVLREALEPVEKTIKEEVL